MTDTVFQVILSQGRRVAAVCHTVPAASLAFTSPLPPPPSSLRCVNVAWATATNTGWKY